MSGTSAQVVETSVTVNNSPVHFVQDCSHRDDHIPLTYDMNPGLRPFTLFLFYKNIVFSDQAEYSYFFGCRF